MDFHEISMLIQFRLIFSLKTERVTISSQLPASLLRFQKNLQGRQSAISFFSYYDLFLYTFIK